MAIVWSPKPLPKAQTRIHLDTYTNISHVSVQDKTGIGVHVLQGVGCMGSWP